MGRHQEEAEIKKEASRALCIFCSLTFSMCRCQPQDGFNGQLIAIQHSARRERQQIRAYGSQRNSNAVVVDSIGIHVVLYNNAQCGRAPSWCSGYTSAKRWCATAVCAKHRQLLHRQHPVGSVRSSSCLFLDSLWH